MAQKFMRNSKETTPQDFKNCSPSLQLNTNHTTLYVPLQFDKYENQGLLDNFIQSALFEQKSMRCLHTHPEVLLNDSLYRISHYQMLIVISSQLEDKYYFGFIFGYYT